MNQTVSINLEKELFHEELKERLSQEHECYILITCKGGKDGTLNAEMSYGGDPTLASYLLMDAQNRIDDEIEDSLE